MNISIVKPLFSIIILVSSACLWMSCTCDSGGPETHFPIDVGQRPESITRGFGGNYYVTVMNGQEDGDGVVKVIQGSDVSVFATGLNEPKGIAYVGNYLVASDLDRVVKIDSKGAVSVLAGRAAFPHVPSYLNDVSADGKGTGVYVTDMGANTKMRDSDGNLWPLDSPQAALIPAIGRVYHVGLDGKVTLVIDGNPLMPTPNGVGVGKDGQLLVGAFFTGNFLIHENGQLRVLCDGLRGADAVEQDSKGNYYASSWTQGKVWKISEDGSNKTVLIEGLRSAADFYLEEENNRLLLPDMLAGKVVSVSLQLKR